MKKAVIYARVSTVRQAEEELPIDSQLAKCRARAEDLGATVVREFVDEGITGTKADIRPAFQACIEYCELTGPAYLITWSTSRFARNRRDAVNYKFRLARAGVDLTYVSLPLDRATSGGMLTEGVLELFDEHLSRQIAADTTRSMVQNAERGYFNGGRTPFGFQTEPAADDPKRKRLAPYDPEAVIALEIFHQRAQGMGAKTIAITLNDRGLRNRGRAWTKSSISALLRNEVVIGHTVFGRKDRNTGRRRPRDQWIVVESHAAIVPSDLWNQVRALMDEATNNTHPEKETGSPHSTFLFTGLLYCPDGTSMQIETAKGRNKRYSYYNCSSNIKRGEGRPRRIPARELDEWLRDHILDTVFTPDFLQEVVRDLQDLKSDWYQERDRRRASAEASIRTLTEKNNRIFELFETYGRDTPNLGDVTKRLRANNEEIKTWEAELAAIDAEQPPQINVTADQIDELSEALSYIIESTTDPKKLRQFFGSFIHRIVVGTASVRIEYRPEALVSNPEPAAVPSNWNWLPERPLLGTLKTFDLELPPAFRQRAA